jgi:hypothetical protein
VAALGTRHVWATDCKQETTTKRSGEEFASKATTTAREKAEKQRPESSRLQAGSRNCKEQVADDSDFRHRGVSQCPLHEFVHFLTRIAFSKTLPNASPAFGDLAANGRPAEPRILISKTGRHESIIVKDKRTPQSCCGENWGRKILQSVASSSDHILPNMICERCQLCIRAMQDALLAAGPPAEANALGSLRQLGQSTF